MTRREEMKYEGLPRIHLDIPMPPVKPCREDPLVVSPTRIEAALLKLVHVEAMRGANEASTRPVGADPRGSADFTEIGDCWAAAREKEIEGGK
jgi:hypothetical protein